MPDIYLAKAAETPNQPENTAGKEKIDLGSLKGGGLLGGFSALLVNPSNIRFDTQETGEQVIFLLRRHWVTNIPWILMIVVLLLAPRVLRFFPLIDFLPVRYQFMAVILWYFLTISITFEQFLIWFFNVYIVTNERVVDFDFYNLLYKSVSEAQIDRIQDVSYTMGGIFQTLLNYGTIVIETAGEQPNLRFELVPNPAQIVKVLQQLISVEEGEGKPV